MISGSLEKRIARVARQTGSTIDGVAREAILRYVEDSEDADHAQRILRRVRSGREKTYTLDEVAERLEL